MIKKDKLSEIDIQIKVLQDKKKKLEEKQSLQLAQLIKKSGASILPSEILVGSLLDAVKAFEENIDTIKKWQKSGQEFLKSGKDKKEEEEGKKSKNTFRPSPTKDH